MRRIAQFCVPAPPPSTDRAKRVACGLRPRQPSFPHVLGLWVRRAPEGPGPQRPGVSEANGNAQPEDGQAQHGRRPTDPGKGKGRGYAGEVCASYPGRPARHRQSHRPVGEIGTTRGWKRRAWSLYATSGSLFTARHPIRPGNVPRHGHPSELPDAVPHVRWCGSGELITPRDPIGIVIILNS